MNYKLPRHFCWTRYGTESGESIRFILARKEQERLTNQGVFLWGIGNSVGPAMRELVKRERSPMVIFSPMLSKPKRVDVVPSTVLSWRRAVALDGINWPIPEGSTVLSRGASENGRSKRVHYALVCHSAEPLCQTNADGVIVYEQLVNLVGQTKLGHSQVTAVVERKAERLGNTQYRIGFAAELVFPYFVKLLEPVMDCARTSIARGRVNDLTTAQSSLLAA